MYTTFLFDLDGTVTDPKKGDCKFSFVRVRKGWN